MMPIKRGRGRPADESLKTNPNVPIDVRASTRGRLRGYKKRVKANLGKSVSYDQIINTLLDKAEG